MKFIFLLFLISNFLYSEEYPNVKNAQKEIIKITKNGFEPQEIVLSKLDASIFFLNATNDSLITLKIDFGEKAAHCASGNMKYDKGTLVSTKPIAPKDFAITCFPQAGKYQIAAYGFEGKKEPIISYVTVKSE